MKSIQEINESYKKFEKVSGINLAEIKQGSDEWLHSKLGILGASNAYKALLGSKGVRTQTSKSFLLEMAGQVLNKEMPHISGKALEWGTNAELAARSIAEFELGVKIIELPIIFKDEKYRVACSPDGYGEQPIEIKAPYNCGNHVNFIANQFIKPEWLIQIQYSIWVTDAPSWLFCSYDPRASKNQLVSKKIERDEKMSRRFDLEIPLFIEEMDEILDSCGVKFGDQWK